MAIIGAASIAPRKTAILPEGGRDFLRRRMMELVGAAVAGLGVVLLLVSLAIVVAYNRILVRLSGEQGLA